MSEIKLAGALPKGSSNGLGVIVQDLCDHPDHLRVVLAVVDVKDVVTNTDTGEVVPTLRIRAIEAITGHDKTAARRLMDRAKEQRTGRPMLPLDTEDELASAFTPDYASQ